MDVGRIASLANLTLTSEEVTNFAPQLEETLKTIDNINELDTSKVEPTAQVTGLTNVLREDVIDKQRILPVEIALSQAKLRSGNYFVVPAVINQ